MDRAEQVGLGVAFAGHIALFGALSLGLLRPPELPTLDNDPVEVTLASEVDLKSAAPTITAPASAPPSPSPPQAASMAPAPIVAAPPPPPIDKPVQKLQPPPKPKPITKTEPKSKAPTPVIKPPRSEPDGRRRPGLSNSIVAGLTDAPTPAKSVRSAKPDKVVAATATNTSAAPPAPSAVEAGAIKRALGQEIGRQLKPRWKSPSGADIDQLVTILSWDLAKDGSLIGEPRFVDQTGVTPSNGPQAKLHRDNAIKAVRAAAPFRLPPEHYAYWKSIISFRFDKRLSQ